MRIKSKRIYASEFQDSEFLDNDNNIDDAIDDMSDTLDDMSDTLDDIKEEDPNIGQENNISGHYIAECENCTGIFISALTQTEQQVECIHGVCPICDKEGDQYLKWIIEDVEYDV